MVMVKKILRTVKKILGWLGDQHFVDCSGGRGHHTLVVGTFSIAVGEVTIGIYRTLCSCVVCVAMRVGSWHDVYHTGVNETSQPWVAPVPVCTERIHVCSSVKNVIDVVMVVYIPGCDKSHRVHNRYNTLWY